MNNLSEIEVAELIKQIVCIYFQAPDDAFTRRTRKSEYIKIKHTCCYLIPPLDSLVDKKGSLPCIIIEL